MDENKKQKVKLIMVEEKPYIISLDKIELGDKVIVTVGGQYPSIVNCENETIREILITDCLPNILRWELIEKPIDYVNKYNYSVSLTENNEIFYKGQFNY